MRNIRVDDPIWGLAKSSAALCGMTLQAWLSRAILVIATDDIEMSPPSSSKEEQE